MTESDHRLVAILRIARHATQNGGARALRDALVRAGYAAYRPHFGSAELRVLLLAHPSLVEEWLAYAEGKPTTEGWYVLRDGQIGQLLHPTSQLFYPSIEEAIAEYVVRELDYWAGRAAEA